jgi:hypothetical protein
LEFKSRQFQAKFRAVPMNANGPAIKLVNVAERLEAGEQDVSSTFTKPLRP